MDMVMVNVIFHLSFVSSQERTAEHVVFHKLMTHIPVKACHSVLKDRQAGCTNSE